MKNPNFFLKKNLLNNWNENIRNDFVFNIQPLKFLQCNEFSQQTKEKTIDC